MSVEIFTVQESLILRARGSELLILPHHAKKLNALKVPKDFCAYFMNEALVNRPARKLFEAWLRKDVSLWKRIFAKIQTEMEFAAEAEGSDSDADAGNKAGAENVKAKKVGAEKVEPAAGTGLKAAKPSKKTESAVAVEEKADKAEAKKKPKAETATEKTEDKAAVKKKAAPKAAAQKSAVTKTVAKPAAEKPAAKAPAKKSSTGVAPKTAKKK
jgi:hypothetical protein